MNEYKELTCWLSRDVADCAWVNEPRRVKDYDEEFYWDGGKLMAISGEDSSLHDCPSVATFLGTRKLFGCKPGECVKLVRDAVGEPWRRAEG